MKGNGKIMAPKYEMRDEEDSDGGLFASVKNLILQPFRIALSKEAFRAYLTTFLVIATGITLLGFAITAYTLFYWSYIPRIGFERPVHLQFDDVFKPSDSRYSAARGATPYPHGTVSLSPEIVSVQRYDVAIELTLPRTPENMDAGNFMLEVNMYAPEEKGTSLMDTVQAGLASGSAAAKVLATSRRPAMLPYRSQIVETAYKISELHWYLLDWRSEEDKLYIEMFESVEFPKGWRNVPSTLKLEIQSSHRMQIRSAKAIFRARFRGLRWLMYNHRVISALLFIGGFWMTEMMFAGLAWAALTLFVVPPTQDVKAEEVHEVAKRIKEEPEDEDVRLSDTERTFPTLSGQQPLRYSNPKTIKQEDEEAAVLVPGDGTGQAAEADDEDEDADFFLDSGLGTSMESSANRRESARRRRGRTSMKDES
ncbi:hypothetical protein LTR36_000516 [Oleoguttula mirabilis]|uniref:Seipin n=1 Tax=Oleoguttula mirabilis TaxID=1507867 RepID=A0AAV9JPN3_9PEZI|nr:hypothetical protein LTR36_000516 [Oleoguttula mirabilis]